MLGFCKKVILANNLATVAMSVFDKDAVVTIPLCGLVLFVIVSRFFTIFQDTPIWQSGLGKCSVFSSTRIFVILIFQNLFQNFGVDGIFRWDNGLGTMSTFHSAAQESLFQSTSSIFLLYGF